VTDPCRVKTELTEVEIGMRRYQLAGTWIEKILPWLFDEVETVAVSPWLEPPN